MVRFGGAKGRNFELKADDIIVVQPTGTGHQRLLASKDLLVVGAYLRNDYDEWHPTKAGHNRALRPISQTKAPRADPVYGTKGPLKTLWR